MTATSVFIYNTRDPYGAGQAAQYGDVSLFAYSSTLKAPSSVNDPYYGGLLVFNDRSATTSVSLSYAPTSMQGSIYSKSGEVDITAGNVNAGLEMVAQNIVFSRNSTNSGTLHAFRNITIPANKTLVSNGGLLETDGAGGVPFLPLGAVTLNSGTVAVNQLYLTNNGSSSLTFNAGLLQSEGTTVTNGMVFAVGDGVQSATLDLLGGTHSFANGLKLSTNSSLIGSGDILAGSATNFGIIAPGHSAGTLTFSGDLTLNDSSLLSMEIGGTATNDYDQVWVGGFLRIGGLLDVTLTNGYTGNAGDTFDLFNFGTVTGAFSQTNLPTLGAGMEWNTDRLYTLGEIAIVPEPGAWSLLALGMAALGARRVKSSKFRVKNSGNS
ncbi:MAG: PEP-CTERM sorting domain-containing protein [Verrucomicrobia bacterium]|nr:PEP-CTERM sorting domain-containing protein [Verrucomicrobiota bacterium]